MSKNPLLKKANNGILAEKELTCDVFIVVVERHEQFCWIEGLLCPSLFLDVHLELSIDLSHGQYYGCQDMLSNVISPLMTSLGRVDHQFMKAQLLPDLHVHFNRQVLNTSHWLPFDKEVSHFFPNEVLILSLKDE